MMLSPLEELKSFHPDAVEDDPIDLGPDGRAHDVLIAIYRNPRMPWRARMQAARDAIAYESPKLAVTATTALDETFAGRLDRARKRSAKVIAAPITPKPEPEPEKPPPDLWLPTVPNMKRFRRRF
jgi:hypothetical protein